MCTRVCCDSLILLVGWRLRWNVPIRKASCLFLTKNLTIAGAVYFSPRVSIKNNLAFVFVPVVGEANCSLFSNSLSFPSQPLLQGEQPLYLIIDTIQVIDGPSVNEVVLLLVEGLDHDV